MKFYLPNFKNFSKEHAGPLIAGILIVIVLAGSMYFFLTEKPDYSTLQASIYRGDYATAITEGESLLDRNSKDIFLIQTLASAYLGEAVLSGDTEKWANKAIDLLNNSIANGKEDTESIRLVGYGYFILKNYKSAETYYRKSIALDSKNDLAWADLGQLYEIKADYKNSDTYYDKALSIDHKNTLANLGKLRTLIRKNQNKLAEATGKKLLATDVFNESMAKANLLEVLGQIKYSQREFSEAKSYFEKSVAINPKSPHALVGLALAIIGDIPNHIIKTMTEETEIPEKLALAALKLDPNYSYAYVVLAKVATLRSNVDDAKKYKDLIIKTSSKDPSLTLNEKIALRKQFSASSTSVVTNLKVISVKKVPLSGSNLGITSIQSK